MNQLSFYLTMGMADVLRRAEGSSMTREPKGCVVDSGGRPNQRFPH
jgi:hypothetical protein